MRILVLAHGHPELSTGGGERAAYALFERLKSHPRITAAVFAARIDRQAINQDVSPGNFRGRPDEILAAPPPVDGFTFQTFGYDGLKHIVDDLVATVRPDVVHVHHFLFWGLEVCELFRKAGVRVVFTLHEYAAICAHYGQMIKTDGQLCYAAAPSACAQCLPIVGPGKYFVRSTIIKTLLEQVDTFIAPSAFLRDRYLDWGLPAERLSVLENILDASVVAQADAQLAMPSGVNVERPLVFGYFAQINPFKGFDVLLKAAALLPEDVRHRISIRIHGENHNYRETEFHAQTERLLASARDVVALAGSYRGNEVIGLMSACDWIVVPSIWWENSPVVMQEARLACRPMIVSDIGGMAEKMDPIADRQFAVADPADLARVMTEIVVANDRSDAKRLRALAEELLSRDAAELSRHMTLYEDVLAR